MSAATVGPGSGVTRPFLLPDLGEGLTESEIVSWRVAVGDSVRLNQVIGEVETAKAVVELPSPYTGTVTALLAEPGTSWPSGRRSPNSRSRPTPAARLPLPPRLRPRVRQGRRPSARRRSWATAPCRRPEHGPRAAPACRS